MATCIRAHFTCGSASLIKYIHGVIQFFRITVDNPLKTHLYNQHTKKFRRFDEVSTYRSVIVIIIKVQTIRRFSLKIQFPCLKHTAFLKSNILLNFFEKSFILCYFYLDRPDGDEKKLHIIELFSKKYHIMIFFQNSGFYIQNFSQSPQGGDGL